MARGRAWFRGFELWTTPRHVVAYVLIVDAIAVAATAATAGLLPITRTDWVRLAILVGFAVAHVEMSRGIERVRKLAAGTGPFVDGLTPWHFAAVLVLPASLAGVLVVFTQTYVWFRVWRGRRPLYRWVFTAATVLWATQASALILATAPGPHPGIPTGWVGLGLVLAAALLRWLINYALVLGAIMVSSPNLRAAQIIGEFGEQLLEAGALGLGLAAAGLLALDPRLLIGIVVGLVALNRGVLLAQFRNAARTDAKTGLHTAGWWHQIARHTMERADASGSTVAVLMLDLDHFKRVNDTYGHLAGDKVLSAVAEAISSIVRADDAVGRWGGEEFAVLIPNTEPPELRSIAERIRRQVSALVVDVTTDNQPAVISDLTISAGGAIYPRPDITGLDGLLLAADSALYVAKETGRDRVHLSPDPIRAVLPDPRAIPAQPPVPFITEVPPTSDVETRAQR